MTERSIAEFEDDIRNHINRRRKQHELLQRSADWNKLCSALDVVGDTECGLDAYLDQPNVENVGLRYLYIYGALQLLQTQQDAVVAIADALKIQPSFSPKLPNIREIRSDSVAHPVDRKDKKSTKSSFIQRMNLDQYSFTMMTVFSDERPYKLRSISIPKLVAEQRARLKEFLSEVVNALEEEMIKHRSEISKNPLEDVFPPTLGYYFEKLYQAIHDEAYFPQGAMHVELLQEILVDFRSVLELRGEWGVYDAVEYQFDELEYPILRLSQFFDDAAASGMNQKDANIFARFIEVELKQLRELAIDIDAQ